MTILFVGSEPADFDACTLNVVTTAGYYRSGVRCAMGGNSGVRATAGIAASTTVWLGFRWYKNGLTSGGSTYYQICEFGNANGARWRLSASFTSTPTTTYKLQYRTSGGTWTRSSGRCSAPTWNSWSTPNAPAPTGCWPRPDR